MSAEPTKHEWPITDNPKRIWLQPKCAEEDSDGRQWCHEDVWGKCDEVECGAPSVEYVRVDQFDALVAHNRKFVEEYDAQAARIAELEALAHEVANLQRGPHSMIYYDGVLDAINLARSLLGDTSK